MQIVVDLKPWTCPECLEDFANPDLMGTHLERHREVGRPRFNRRGVAKSVACPKGCGRHFRKMVSQYRPGGLEMEIHLVTCDGSSPLPDLWAVMQRNKTVKWEREPLPVVARTPPPAPLRLALPTREAPKAPRPRRQAVKKPAELAVVPPPPEPLPEEASPDAVLLGAVQLVG